ERGHATKKVWARLKRAAEDRASFRLRLEQTRGRDFSHRDEAFLDKVNDLLRRGFRTEDYMSLFDVKLPLLTGDITPAYCTLGEQDIELIAGKLSPELKVILLIRNPVERLWSQLCMHIRRRPEKQNILHEFEEFEAYVRKPGVQARSFASQSFERWHRHFPDSRIWVGLLDSLRSDAEHFRDEVIHFLGADPAVYSGQRSAGFNRKANQKKFPMSEKHRDYLNEYFGPEIARCARLFGGAAASW
ncbi:MAG: hypothetical protein AAFY56_24875, partial [Pseudomonadota bacterium]